MSLVHKSIRTGSIIIFGKNTHESTPKTLEKVLLVLKENLDLVCEIIVVDDGSDPYLQLPGLLNLKTEISIIRHPVNLGIGDCLLTGCKGAKYQSILFLPGHNFFSLLAISNAVRNLGVSEVALGYRLNSEVRPAYKRFSSLLLRQGLRLLVGMSITDPHGLHIYPRDFVLKNLPENARHSLHIHLLTSLKRTNLKITQFPAPISGDFVEPNKPSLSKFLTYVKSAVQVTRVLVEKR